MAEPPTLNYALPLDDYEIANLREGLLTLRALKLDTGDWMGQILMKLPETECQPNKSQGEQTTQTLLWFSKGILT